MQKKVFIFSNLKKIKKNLKININFKINFYNLFQKMNKNLLKKINKRDYIILILLNEKNNNLENKIFILSEFLEIINKLKYKNKIFILNKIISKKNNSFDKLENKIISEIVLSYNNMFKLDIDLFDNKFKEKINLDKELKKMKK